MGRVRHWFTLAVCTLGFWGLPLRAFAAPTVDAEVVWIGPCGDRARLANELRERGVEFLSRAESDRGTVGLRLSVSVRVQVSAPENRRAPPPQFVADLDLADARGGHEKRTVEVDRCAELHPALAVILASFAERPSAESRPDSTATTTPPEIAEQPSSGSGVPASPLIEPAAPIGEPRTPPSAPLPPQTTEPTPHPQSALPQRLPQPLPHDSQPSTRASASLARFEVRTTHRRSAGSRELRLGSHAVWGLGWVPASAVGAGAHLEWRPVEQLPLTVRATFGYVPTTSYHEGGSQIVWRRRFGRLDALLQLPVRYLKVSLGAELGDVKASTPDLVGHSIGRSTWFALLAMPRFELPLVDRVLFLECATGAAIVPTRYSLKYADTGQSFAATSRFEWRTEVGLSVRIAPSFP